MFLNEVSTNKLPPHRPYNYKINLKTNFLNYINIMDEIYSLIRKELTGFLLLFFKKNKKTISKN